MPGKGCHVIKASGMLTRENRFMLKLPNLNMRNIFVEYFNELHYIDVSTRYADRAF